MYLIVKYPECYQNNQRKCCKKVGPETVLKLM